MYDIDILTTVLLKTYSWSQKPVFLVEPVTKRLIFRIPDSMIYLDGKFTD